MRQELKDFGFGEIYKDATLDNLIFPVDVAEKIMAWIQNPKNIFFFAGTPGVGKTYLCAAIIKKYCQERRLIYYMKEQNFFSKLRTMMQSDTDYQYEINKLADMPFVILDDMGSSQMTDWQKEVLFSLVDARCQNSLPTLITSNLFIKSLYNTFSPRFVSRLKDKRNIIIELEWIDKRQLDIADTSMTPN